MTAPLRHSRPLLRPEYRSQDKAPPQAEVSAIRVMIVDDSLTVRTIFKRMVEGHNGMEIVGTASSAENAIVQLQSVETDVVLLDLEMPGMGGLEALPKILEEGGNAQVLVVSSLTEDGAEHTVSALAMGAADTMLKPRPGGFNDEYRTLLLDKIAALGVKPSTLSTGDDAPASSGVARATAAKNPCAKRPEVVAIGASTGGIHALNQLLTALPEDFDLPILVTQHLPSSFIPVFARQVEMVSGRRAYIADDGTQIRGGEIAIASGQGHLEVRRVGDRLIAKTTNRPSVSGCLPSVDPMLSSLAKTCDGHVLAVILSGMGRDGLEGATEVVELGGTVFAQDAESSAVWGMPGAVAKANLTSLIADPEELSAAIHAQTGAPAWK